MRSIKPSGVLITSVAFVLLVLHFTIWLHPTGNIHWCRIDYSTSHAAAFMYSLASFGYALFQCTMASKCFIKHLYLDHYLLVVRTITRWRHATLRRVSFLPCCAGSCVTITTWNESSMWRTHGRVSVTKCCFWALSLTMPSRPLVSTYLPEDLTSLSKPRPPGSTFTRIISIISTTSSKQILTHTRFCAIWRHT